MIQPSSHTQANDSSALRAMASTAACEGPATPIPTQSEVPAIETELTPAQSEQAHDIPYPDEPTPPHITLDGATRLAPLEHYIVLAEQASLGSEAPSRPQNRVFERANGVQGPVLRSDHENRILIYPGSFNPPHQGHASLLWHAYLATDAHTIAVLILNMDTSSLGEKTATEEDGKEFLLTVQQRSQLWRDSLLDRFTWSYPSEDPDNILHFAGHLVELCAKDGFRIYMPSLHGGDHMNKQDDGCGWGMGTVIGSDIGRPVHFVKGEYEDVRLDLEYSKKWKKMATRLVHTEPAEECASCWPCRKLRAVFPEFYDKDRTRGKSALYCTSSLAFEC